MTDCIFCKIASKEIGSDLLLETEELVAFKDLHPQAPVHILIIPRRHIAGTNDLAAADTQLVGKMFLAAKELAEKLEVAASGYRLIVNCGADGGQVVPHLHLHLLGGKKMGPKGQEI